MSNEFLSRTELLLGTSGIEKMQQAHVLVLGLGGVGAYAAEFLVRSGLGAITIVDADSVELSNCNRQLIALRSTIGCPKCEVLRERLLDINPDCKITAIQEFIAEEKIDKLLDRTQFDYIVDAIDSVSSKVYFILGAHKRQIPLVASMGSGGRMDPTQIRVADIAKTYNCGLARAVRKGLKKHGITKGVVTVFSPELVAESSVMSVTNAEGKVRSFAGTCSYLPAAFGGVLASVVTKALTK